mmetsp:Transcript_4839/g.21880  ORF Transcript_4839/g.21880 Transcript_4839/m.21880 type:complete len:223 (+) Transcript_4839:234-902(+)
MCRDPRGHEPSSHEMMGPRERLRAELWRRERHEQLGPHAFSALVSLVHAPPRRYVHSNDGRWSVVGVEELQQRIERRSRRSGEGEPEERVDHDVAFGHQRVAAAQSLGVDEVDPQGVQLGDQAVVYRPVRALRVTHLDIVPEVVQVPRGDQAVTPVVSWPAQHEHPAVGPRRVHLAERGRDAQTRELHELIDAKPELGTHELFVDLLRLRRGDEGHVRHRVG